MNLKLCIQRLTMLVIIVLLAPLASADVSGSWTFSVTLGELGSGNASVTMNQEAEGKLTGTYSGQLANGPVTGTYNGNDFEFSFNSEALGGSLTYKGTMKEDGTLAGAVIVQGQEFGTFTGRKSG
ncbi:MAG: hypothetical protein WD772_02530 [Pseudohongiellaceae bacterium]